MSEISEGGSEISESTEVNEVPSSETGGEASEATQEAVMEEANKTGGFEETDDIENLEYSDEDYGEPESDAEIDETQDIGFDDSDFDNENDIDDIEDTDPSDENIDPPSDSGDEGKDESLEDFDDVDENLEEPNLDEQMEEEEDPGEPEDYSDDDILEADDDTEIQDEDVEAETDAEENIDDAQEEGEEVREDQIEDPDTQVDENEAEVEADPEDLPEEDVEAEADAEENIDDDQEEVEETEADAEENLDDAQEEVEEVEADAEENIDDVQEETQEDREDQIEDPDIQVDEDEAEVEADPEDLPEEDVEAEADAEENIDDDQGETQEDREDQIEDPDTQVDENEAEVEADPEDLPEEDVEAEADAEENIDDDQGETQEDREDQIEDPDTQVDENEAEVEADPEDLPEEDVEAEADVEKSIDDDPEEVEEAEADAEENIDDAQEEDEEAEPDMLDQNVDPSQSTEDEYDQYGEYDDYEEDWDEGEPEKYDEDEHRSALNSMAEYMSEHNYGPDNYAEYSKDPEWQKLNADLQRSLGMEVDGEKADTATASESGKDISVTELPDNCVVINAADIDMTYAQGMDSGEFWNHHGNTKEDYMRVADKIPDVQQALESGKSLDEIKQDPELGETVRAYFDPDNMIKVEQQSDGSYSFTDDGRHRIAAAQEGGYQIPVEVTNMSEITNASNTDGSDVKTGSDSFSEIKPKEIDTTEDINNKFDISNETRESLASFEQNNWDNLSEVEKEKAVEKLRDSIAEDLKLENKPNIAYYNNDAPGDYGGYAASTNTIYINRFNMDDAAETADTIAHESRHCWQHERAENPQTEQDYQFKENFDDYVRPEDDFYEYQNQPVEADARNYAAEVKDAIPKQEDISEKNSPGNGEKRADGESDDKASAFEIGPLDNIEQKNVSVKELPSDFENKNDFTPVSEEVKKSLEGSGLTEEKIKEIRELPKPDYKNSEALDRAVHKPDPQTYLNPEYVNKHLEAFEKTGCFKIQRTDPTSPDDIYGGVVGHESGLFVTSGEEMKKAIQESGGDVRKMESLLGLQADYLGNNPTIISFDSPSNLRMPDGNEIGATRKEFIPGGFTSGNMPEAVIDPVPKGGYEVKKFNDPKLLDWVEKKGEIS